MFTGQDQKKKNILKKEEIDFKKVYQITLSLYSYATEQHFNRLIFTNYIKLCPR